MFYFNMVDYLVFFPLLSTLTRPNIDSRNLGIEYKELITAITINNNNNNNNKDFTSLCRMKDPARNSQQ